MNVAPRAARASPGRRARWKAPETKGLAGTCWFYLYIRLLIFFAFV